jgi:hypothetical protein
MTNTSASTEEAAVCVSPVESLAAGARGTAASPYRVERATRDEKIIALSCRAERCPAKWCTKEFEFFCLYPTKNARVAKQDASLSRRRACREHAEGFAKAHGLEMPR